MNKKLGSKIGNLLAKYLGSVPVDKSKDDILDEQQLRVTDTFVYLAPKIKFRPGITVEDMFDSVETSTVAISFPLPNVANLLELSAVEVVCLILEGHLFELLRSTAGTIYSTFCHYISSHHLIGLTRLLVLSGERCSPVPLLRPFPRRAHHFVYL